MRYKEIIGGTQEEAEAKFPWLAEADVEDATIDITKDYLIWTGGVWKGGVWQGGVWVRGVWEGGWWQDGTWRGGVWVAGEMWSNIRQAYLKVKQVDNQFVEEE